MKKLISLLFAVLVSTMMFGQVSMDLNVIGRVDANPRFTFDGEKPTFNWANTSVYTKLETSINEKFTIMLVNHWAGSGEELYPFGATPDLYKNSFMSDCSTWVDYLYFDWQINDNWSVRAGKDVIAIGGFEYDDWDWDVDYDMASSYWNDNAAYQWGVSGAWTNNDGNTTLRLQAVSSPYAYNFNLESRPWYQGCGSYYFQHDGSYGIIETRNAIGLIQTGELLPNNKFDRYNTFHVSAGARANLLDESLIVGADFLNEYTKEFENNHFHFLATAKYIAPSEKWEVLGKLGIENYNWAGEGETSVFGGVSGAYFPLKNSQDLRLQGTIAYNPYFNKGLSFTIGLTYNLPIHIL